MSELRFFSTFRIFSIISQKTKIKTKTNKLTGCDNLAETWKKVLTRPYGNVETQIHFIYLRNDIPVRPSRSNLYSTGTAIVLFLTHTALLYQTLAV